MQVVKKPNIPKDWNITKITNEFKISHGKLPKEVFSEKGKDRLPYLTTNSLKGQSNKFADKTDGVLVENNDIIIIGDGEGSGRCYFGKKGILSSTFLLLKNKHQKIINEFVYLYLKLNYQFFNNTKYGSGIPHIDQYLLREFQIPVPPLPEQQQIVSIISNVDDTIQKTDQIIEQTQRLKKGMMQKLLTKGIGHKKFKKVKWYFGKEIEIPEEWEVKEFSELILKSRNGFTGKPNDESYGIPRLGISSISESDTIYVKEHIHRFIEIEKSKIDTYLIEKNDLLVCRQNGNLDLIGKARLAQGTIHTMIFSDSLISLKIKTDEIMVEFLTRFLDHKIGRDQVSRYFTTTAGNYSINGTNLKKIKILSPSLPEQQQITSILSNIDAQIGKEKLHKSNLERLKKGLMQKLLTGQIRVKVK